MVILGESGLEKESSIVGSGREALTDGRALIAFLGGSVEGGGSKIVGVGGDIDERSGEDRLIGGSV